MIMRMRVIVIVSTPGYYNPPYGDFILKFYIEIIKKLSPRPIGGGYCELWSVECYNTPKHNAHMHMHKGLDGLWAVMCVRVWCLCLCLKCAKTQTPLPHPPLCWGSGLEVESTGRKMALGI
jgi:hypothetical protein